MKTFSNNTKPFPTKKTLLQIFKPIFLILLMCGFDFNYWKCKVFFKVLLKSYCVSLVFINIIATTECCKGQEISTIWSLIEYTGSVSVTLILENKITDFFQRLTDIDSYLKIKTKYYYHVKNRMFFYTFILWVVRVIYTILYCIWYPFYDNFVWFLMSQFSLIALDLNRVWRFILVDMTLYRLKLLRKHMEEVRDPTFFLYVTNNKTLKQSRVTFSLHLYKSLADAMDLIIPELHASLFISLVCTLPKFILNAYHVLLVIEEMEPVASLGFAVMHVCQVTLFIFAPCVVVELFSVEVEKMRLFLIHKLMDEPDPLTKEEIDLFLRYSELRPFRYRIWRVVPVNVALPLELINLCTAYVIVLINFTHLYG